MPGLHPYTATVLLSVEACRIMEEVIGAREHSLLDLAVIIICEKACVTADGGGYVVGPFCVIEDFEGCRTQIMESEDKVVGELVATVLNEKDTTESGPSCCTTGNQGIDLPFSLIFWSSIVY